MLLCQPCPDFQEKMLTGFLNLRNELIRYLVQHGLTDFKVLDTCCNTGCTTTASVPERLKVLMQATAKDGVHLNAIGYSHLTERATQCFKRMLLETRKRLGNSLPFSGEVFGARAGQPGLAQIPSVPRGNPALRGTIRGTARGDRRGNKPRPYHPYKRW